MYPYTIQKLLKTCRSCFISFSQYMLERILALVRKRFELCGIKGLNMMIYLRAIRIWNNTLDRIFRSTYRHTSRNLYTCRRLQVFVDAGRHWYFCFIDNRTHTGQYCYYKCSFKCRKIRRRRAKFDFDHALLYFYVHLENYRLCRRCAR